MKKVVLFAVLVGVSISSVLAQSYKYTFKINGVADTSVFLANYFGNKMYYYDTAYADAKGTIAFQGEEKPIGGIYAVVLPGNRYFEIVVDEDRIEMETDTSDLIGKMKVTYSKENQLFYEYMQFIADKKSQAASLKTKIDQKEGEDVAKEKEKLQNLDKMVKDYQYKLIADNPNTLLSKIIKMSLEVEVPEAPKKEDGSIDSLFAYNYFKTHYFDNIDLSDNRLVRTPMFHEKLDYFFQKLLPQVPDTVAKEADRIISMTKGSEDMFKYIVHYITYNYETSKIMGMDAVFVHMAENYYMKGQAFWLDSSKVAKITERATKLKPLLINKKAPFLKLQDTSATKWVSLYDVKADYTILYFWDSGCGHCKKETPKLKKLYDQYKNKGVKVYAVGTELETEEWKKYIRENELDWINVSDTPEQPNIFRTNYDIFSTPKLFLLDKDKRIVAKQLGVEQLEEFLGRKIEDSSPQ